MLNNNNKVKNDQKKSTLKTNSNKGTCSPLSQSIIKNNSKSPGSTLKPRTNPINYNINLINENKHKQAVSSTSKDLKLKQQDNRKLSGNNLREMNISPLLLRVKPI